VEADFELILVDTEPLEQILFDVGIEVEKDWWERVQEVRVVLCEAGGVVEVGFGAVGFRHRCSRGIRAGVVLCAFSEHDAEWGVRFDGVQLGIWGRDISGGNKKVEIRRWK